MKWFFLLMYCAGVVGQCEFGRKAFVTNIALEILDFFMFSCQMSPQIKFAAKIFIAHGAFECPFSLMNSFNM